MIDRIIAAIAEASLDDRLWPNAAALIDEALSTQGSHLLVMRWPPGADPSLLFESGCENHNPVEWAEDYALNYFHRDERIPRFLRLPDAQVTYVPELYTSREHKRSATFNELLLRSGGRRGLNFRLDGPEEHSHVAFGLTESLDGPDWSSAQVGLVRTLVPHIRQFVRVRQALARAEGLPASLTVLLDSLPLGVVILDREGRIAEVNAAAMEMLRQGALADRDGFLRARGNGDDARLRRLIANALPKWPRPPVGGTITIGGVSLPPTYPPPPPGTGAATTEVQVVPLATTFPHYGANRPSVLVLLTGARASPPGVLGVDRLQTTLGLTAAEGEVVASLAEGRSVRAIAEQSHRAEATVRWHIKQIKEKLGVSRQVDLVRLALSAVDPGLPRAE